MRSALTMVALMLVLAAVGLLARRQLAMWRAPLPEPTTSSGVTDAASTPPAQTAQTPRQIEQRVQQQVQESMRSRSGLDEGWPEK